MGLYVCSLPMSLLIIVKISILYLIIKIISEIWIINHCLELGHETMVFTVCLQCWKLNFWSTHPNTDVPYMFYTKFHSPRPIFYSPSSKCTRVGERMSISFPRWSCYDLWCFISMLINYIKYQCICLSIEYNRAGEGLIYDYRSIVPVWARDWQPGAAPQSFSTWDRHICLWLTCNCDPTNTSH